MNDKGSIRLAIHYTHTATDLRIYREDSFYVYLGLDDLEPIYRYLARIFRRYADANLYLTIHPLTRINGHLEFCPKKPFRRFYRNGLIVVTLSEWSEEQGCYMYERHYGIKEAMVTLREAVEFAGYELEEARKALL